MSSSSSNTPCAACKIQRRKCTQECIFAPYFPPDNPQKFQYVHKVFGASNVAKLLNDVSVSQREDTVKSLAYEAEARLRDPVYGCVGHISLLQHKLKSLQSELNLAKKELASVIGPQAILPPIPSYTPGFHQPPRNSFPITAPSQNQEVFANNLEGLSASTSSYVSLPHRIQDQSFNHIQVNPFHNLMLSPSQQQQQQPYHSFFSQKFVKYESENHGQGTNFTSSD